MAPKARQAKGKARLSNYLKLASADTKDRADKRAANLKKGGTHADVVQRDSVNFLVLATVNCKVYDTTRFKDSLVRMFGYKEVMIYK